MKVAFDALDSSDSMTDGALGADMVRNFASISSAFSMAFEGFSIAF